MFLPLSYSIGLLMIIAGVAISYFLAKQIGKEEYKKSLNQDSVVVISGACQGIGRMLAVTFALQHRCNIVIYDTQKELAKTLMRQIQYLGGTGHFYECNFSNKDTIFHSLAMTLAKFQTIDIFINTSGAILEKDFDDYTVDDLQANIQANFFGPSILIKEMLAIMKRQSRGHIVNVPCSMDKVYSTDLFTYFGAKTGLNRMLLGLQKDLEIKEPKVKITVARSFVYYCKPEQEENEENNLSISKMSMYADTIYEGILQQKKVI